MKISPDAYVFRLFTLGFFIRVIVMFLDYYEIVGIPGNGDETQFHWTALDNQYSREETKITNYTVFLTIFYRLTNCSRLLAQYLNVLMGMFFLVYLNKTLKIVNAENKIRKRLLVIATFMPNLIIFSSILLREAWIEMFVMMSIYHYVNWFIRDGKSYHAFMSLVFVLCASWMHSGCVVIVIGYLLSFVFFERNTKQIKTSNTFIPSLFLLSLFAAFLYYNASLFSDKFGSISNVAAEDMMVDMYTVTGDSGSTYLSWLNVTTPLQAVFFSPLKMFYFLFSPIPFDWRNLLDVIAFTMDSMIYIFLFYQIYRNWTNSKENRYLICFLLISFFIATFVFAFGTIASGTAVRHRAKIIALLFVCYALSKDNEVKLKHIQSTHISCRNG